MKHVGAALQMYVSDNDDWMPPYNNPSQPDPVGWHGPDNVHYVRWYQSILMTCWYKSGRYPDPPRSGDGTLQPYAGGHKNGIGAILSCPSVKKGPRKLVVSHAWEQWTDYAWGEKAFGVNYAGACGIPIHQIDVPDHLVYMAESVGWHMGLYQGYYDNPEASSVTTPTPRHFGNFDMVFCDGHVDTGPLETFYQHEYWYNPNTR